MSEISSEVKQANKSLLYIVIGVIILFKIIWPLWEDFGPRLYWKISWIYYKLYWFTDIILISYLYYFIVKLKLQKMSIAAVGLFVIASAFFIAEEKLLHTFGTHFLYSGRDRTLEYFINQIPTLSVFIAQIIIGLQLFRNTAKGSLGKAMKYLGVGYLIKIGFGVLYDSPVLLFFSDLLMETYRVLNFTAMIPCLAMAYMYLIELKELKKN